MLKDLVDYFKLEEINIDNWTFKLYYKVNCLQIGPVWRVSKNMPKACQSINITPLHEYRYVWCVRSVFQYLSNVSRVSCQKNNVLERITVDSRATVSWKKTCTALIQILHTCFIPECDKSDESYFRSLLWSAWRGQQSVLPASTLEIPSGDKIRFCWRKKRAALVGALTFIGYILGVEWNTLE